MTESLDATGRRYGTDKSSLHHNYLTYYETLFRPFREKAFDLLEIGVQDGASIRTWHDYFPNARIVGVDIVDIRLPDELPRYTFARGSQGDLAFLQSLLKQFDFRIVIDDGSHMWTHQIFTFETIFPWLKRGGIYICEDVQTSFGELANQYRGSAHESPASYFLRIAERMAAGDSIVAGDDEDPMLHSMVRLIRSLTFIKHCVIVTT